MVPVAASEDTSKKPAVRPSAPAPQPKARIAYFTSLFSSSFLCL